jgi:ABC-type transporter Mla subunit MlaD
LDAINRPNFELRVGLFTVIALLILIWGWSWLKSFSLHAPQRFIVEFHDVAGLALNAPVNVNGVRVGTVEKIELKGKGHVLCNLKISSEDLVIPEGSAVTIQTLGLVGAKYVEITLPDDAENKEAIPPGTLIQGQDPVRLELYANKIATNLSNVTDALATNKARESLQEAAESAGDISKNLRSVTAKADTTFGKLGEVASTLSATARKFDSGVSSAGGFFNQGERTMATVDQLALDLRRSDHKLDKILDNPALTGDLKETARLANETATKFQNALSGVTKTVGDKSTRDDLITIFNRIATSTENIKESLQVVQTVSGDKDLRADLRKVLADANATMNKASALLDDKNLIGDARTTMKKVQNAADDLAEASQNINTIVTGKRPLMHLMFGGGTKKTKIKIKQTTPASKDSNEQVVEKAPATTTTTEQTIEVEPAK